MVGSYHLTLLRYGICTVVPIYFRSHLRTLLVMVPIGMYRNHKTYAESYPSITRAEVFRWEESLYGIA
jgi:hypothetical protein